MPGCTRDRVNAAPFKLLIALALGLLTLKEGAMLTSLPVLNKTWPALFLPVFLLRLGSVKRCLIYSLTALAVPVIFTALYVIVFREDPSPLLRRALTHAGVPGRYLGGHVGVDSPPVSRRRA